RSGHSRVPDNHPCDLVSQCFSLTAPFRSMLLTTGRWLPLLSSKGSSDTCISDGHMTFLLAACTAHLGFCTVPGRVIGHISPYPHNGRIATRLLVSHDGDAPLTMRKMLDNYA